MFFGFIQFASIIGIVQFGKGYDKIERKCIEKYLAHLPIDEIKSFNINKYLAKKNGMPVETG